MAQLPNQFSQTPEKGQIALLEAIKIFSCKVDSSETGTLTPATAVKLKDVAGPVLVIEELDAATDQVFGFVPYSVQKNEYVADDMLKVVGGGEVMLMEAGAAIARGAEVEYVVASKKVITSAGTNKKVGLCLDKATADGDLVRVLIEAPAITQP